MSDVAESAIVQILLADYANGDRDQKLNLLGGGIVMLGLDPATNATAPHAVVARVSFAPRHIGESPAVELALEKKDGSLVALPGPDGPQFLRVGSASAIKPVVVPGAYVPRDAVRPSIQFLMYFANGLPLQANHSYTWRVKIDHDTREEWAETFYVLTKEPDPVIG